MSKVVDYHFNFKLLLVGNSGVGKSHFLEYFLGEEYKLNHESIVGVEFVIILKFF